MYPRTRSTTCGLQGWRLVGQLIRPRAHEFGVSLVCPSRWFTLDSFFGFTTRNSVFWCRVVGEFWTHHRWTSRVALKISQNISHPVGSPRTLYKDFKGHEQHYDGRHWSTSLVFSCLESWSRSMDHQGQLNDLSLYLQRLCKAQFGGVCTTCFLIPEMGIPRPNLCHSRQLETPCLGVVVDC